MSTKLTGKRIAILATDGVEQVELTEPRKALDAAGAKTEVVSPAKGKLQAWQHLEKGDKIPVDVELETADPNNYDALLLPGGVANPDQLRMMPKAVRFVRSFFDEGKPVGAICHAPWMLVEADVVREEASPPGHLCTPTSRMPGRTGWIAKLWKTTAW